MSREPVDAETIAIMVEIHQWLDHWQDVMSEPDGPAHAYAFFNSMSTLMNRILEIIQAHETDD